MTYTVRTVRHPAATRPASDREVALAERAIPVLEQEAARPRTRITYAALMARLGTSRHSIGPVLDVVAKMCDERGLPPLYVLVVHSSTGLPNLEGLGVGPYPIQPHEVAARMHECWDYYCPCGMPELHGHRLCGCEEKAS